MAHELQTFVPTPSYRKSLRALEQQKLLFLLGGPGTGKSAIALNVCVTWTAEDPDIEVLRARDVDELDRIITSNDAKKIYWIEDVFGETRLDKPAVELFSRIFHNIRGALGLGAMFVFTCRDYIFEGAKKLLKSAWSHFLESHAIIVTVNNISNEDKTMILYNHLKHGNISTQQKKQLKGLRLPEVVRSPEFTPEIARRLGDKRFHSHQITTQGALVRFFRDPVYFFADVISELGEAERAAITYILIEGNALSDPVDKPPEIHVQAYNTPVAELRSALDEMQGSLVKLVNLSGKRYWQVQHPSMIDAMQSVLGSRPTMMDVYLACVRLDVLFRDVGTAEHKHTVKVPENLYPNLASRLKNVVEIPRLLSSAPLKKNTMRCAVTPTGEITVPRLLRNGWRG